MVFESVKEEVVSVVAHKIFHADQNLFDFSIFLLMAVIIKCNVIVKFTCINY